eukprot:1902181-Amphidinium_carterae.1
MSWRQALASQAEAESTAAGSTGAEGTAHGTEEQGRAAGPTLEVLPRSIWSADGRKLILSKVLRQNEGAKYRLYWKDALHALLPLVHACAHFLACLPEEGKKESQ